MGIGEAESGERRANMVDLVVSPWPYHVLLAASRPGIDSGKGPVAFEGMSHFPLGLKLAERADQPSNSF